MTTSTSVSKRLGIFVARAEDVAQLIRTAPELRGWVVVESGADILRVQGGMASLTLLWPERWIDLWEDAAERERELGRARGGEHQLVLFGSDDELAAATLESLDLPNLHVVPVPAPATRVIMALRAAGHSSRLSRKSASLELELDRARHENDMLISVGRALSQQRDTRTLLEMILLRAREVTGADAGSIYVVEGADEQDVSQKTLRFMVTQNDSLSVEKRVFTLPVSSSSIVGSAVLGGTVINIPDLYELDPPGTGNNPWGFVHDRSFDERSGYRTRSMLTVPMISARQQVIGVIQLINKRARGQTEPLRTERCFEAGVVAFDGVSENYAASLASQAGIALENALLYEEVRTLFEGFVKASVTAIESRDPTTSGHSERVAALTVGLAKATDRLERGSYADLRFGPDDLKQIEYAALLHDFGKVGVREHVLVKAKKLYPHERELLLQRFQLIKKTLTAEHLERKLGYVLEASRERTAAELAAGLSGDLAGGLARLETELAARLGEVDDFVRFILQCNEPTVLEQGGFERLAELASRRYLDAQGEEQPYLTVRELEALQILRGSLTREERAEIESHVVHTFNFLKQIPWGRTFRNVPEIAGAHHEKLDGSGYPHGRRADAIPAPAKMMTISDIYDALTASDRPYKKAMPVDRALDILSAEVKRGAIDGELFQLFVDARIYELSR